MKDVNQSNQAWGQAADINSDMNRNWGPPTEGIKCCFPDTLFFRIENKLEHVSKYILSSGFCHYTVLALTVNFERFGMVDKRREEEAGVGDGGRGEGGEPPQPFITRVTLVSFSSFGGVFRIGLFTEDSTSLENIGLCWVMFPPL